MKKNTHRGHTLILLIVFTAIAVTLTTAAALSTIINSDASVRLQEGYLILDQAESGVENAMLRLLRNPNYTGEVMTMGDTTVTIEVTGLNPKTITSVATSAEYSRTVAATVVDSGGALSISSWQEL